MDGTHNRNEEQLRELLIDHLVFGLEPDAVRELVLLLSGVSAGDLESLERVVATVALAGCPGRFPPLPARLRTRIRATASACLQQAEHPREGGATPPADACGRRDEVQSDVDRNQPGIVNEPAE